MLQVPQIGTNRQMQTILPEPKVVCTTSHLLFLPPKSREDCTFLSHDLKIAMHRVNEAQRLVKMSFANELPHLGFNFYNLSQANSFLANIGVLPNMDIFAGGRKIQHLKFKKDEYKIAIEQYNKTMLVAMQETNDALCTLKSADSKHSISQDRLDLSKKEMSLTEERKKSARRTDWIC